MPKVLRFASPATQIANNIAAAPSVPYSDDVVAIGGGGAGAAPPLGLIQITRQSGTPVLTGPVKVIGECDGKIVELGTLAGGASISPTADLGYQELLDGAGLCTKLGLLPAGVAGGNYNAFYIPVAE